MFSLTDINKMDINRIKKRQINIDSIPSRFEQLVPTVTEHLVVLLVAETNIDCSFPDTRFPINDYTSPCRADKNNQGGGILLQIRKDIPSKHLANLKIFLIMLWSLLSS